MRETEIVDLKKKNEVLEEQVRAIEQNRAVGSEQKIEEVLETVARQVVQRQKQRDTQPDKTGNQGNNRSEKPTIDLSGRDLSRSFSMATRTTPTTVGSGSDPKKDSTAHSATTSSALNLLHLAGNLKNAQALLSALQKNLPQNATLANVKSIASKVLSSTTSRTTTQSNAGSIPRGIVTATTVPKGSSLPPNLASALQQKGSGTSTATTPVLVGGKASQLANHLTSQLKPTTQPSKPSVATDTTTREDETDSNKSTANQALEASALLQQQGGGDLGGASGGLPSITAELIAQCFLNLPNNINASSLTPPTDIDGVTGDNAESVVMATDAAVSAANVLAALGGTLTEGLSTAANHLSLTSTNNLTTIASSLPPSSASSSTSVSPSLSPTTLLATPTANDVQLSPSELCEETSETLTSSQEEEEPTAAAASPPVAKKPKLDPPAAEEEEEEL